MKNIERKVPTEMKTRVVVEMTLDEYKSYLKSLEPVKQPTKEELLKSFSNKEIFDELCRRGHGTTELCPGMKYDLEIDFEKDYFGNDHKAIFKAEELKNGKANW